eukprot:6192261-Pleurochrysis_carterae.AAC.3
MCVPDPTQLPVNLHFGDSARLPPSHAAHLRCSCRSPARFPIAVDRAAFCNVALCRCDQTPSSVAFLGRCSHMHVREKWRWRLAAEDSLRKWWVGGRDR